MSSVSNRFYVEAIDDGTTLHGQLLSTKSLSQAWTNGNVAVPSWTTPANQPTVYVDLMCGASKVTPDEGGTWYYNGNPIAWASSSATATSTDGLFQKVNNYPNSTNPTAAIKIIGNIASSTNVNTDSLTYSGTYTLQGSPIGFSVSTLIKITGISSAGIFGFIEFVGSNVVTEKNQNITMYARLFNANGEELVAVSNSNPFSTTWKMNNTSKGAGTDVTIGGATYYNAKQINESNITDNSVIECTFSYTTMIDGVSTTLTYKAYESIDDQTDYEQMYIQYSGGSDTAATLKPNGTITFDIWMGTQDDPKVDTSWTDFYVKLLGADGTVINSNISGVPNVISSQSDPHYGWRDISGDGSVAHITLTYAIVHDSATFKNYLTGIVLAEKQESA